MRVALLLTALFWLVVFAACALTAPPVPYFDTLTQNPSTEWPQQLRAVTLDDAPTLETRASVLVRYPMSLAQVEGGLPIVVPPRALPIVGRPFVLGWTTRPTAPHPRRRTALLVTLRPPGEPSKIPNGLGGMLMVPPDLVFFPNQVPWLTQTEGEVRLDMTFPAEANGLHVWLQLLVDDERVPARLTTTPMVEMVVGTR